MVVAAAAVAAVVEAAGERETAAGLRAMLARESSAGCWCEMMCA